jgi:hypothetical protein
LRPENPAGVNGWALVVALKSWLELLFRHDVMEEYALVANWLRREDAGGRGTKESSMSKAGLDNRHRDHDGEISRKHSNTLVRALRKIYGQGFAAGYPETAKLSDVLLQLNETSLSQLRRDHETGHLEKKIANASK